MKLTRDIQSLSTFKRDTAKLVRQLKKTGQPVGEAQQWVRQLRTAVSQQLTVVPKAFPLAPEDDEFLEEIRQMIVGRYRVLFTIKGRKVHVLHVRGAYLYRRSVDRLQQTRKTIPRQQNSLHV